MTARNDKKQNGPSDIPIYLAGKMWKYRGEGGANLVISLPQKKSIIRFAKSKYADKDQDGKVQEIAYFANEVMRPLLGLHFVRPVRIGILSQEDLDYVRLEAQPFRPLERHKKGIFSRKVILSHDCVFLTPEYQENTIGDTFSIEIKPKQGWHSLKASCSVDLCHRCLKQCVKLQKGEIDSISHYCPLDLFSGDKVRMKRAIFDLIESPNNRFKLFKNGDLIFTNNIGSTDDVIREMSKFLNCEDKVLDKLAALIGTTLLSSMEKNDAKTIPVIEEFFDLSTDKLFRSSNVCDTKSNPLPKNGILQRILTLQRHTEISDHDAMKLCEKLLSNIDNIEGLHQLVLWHPNAKLEYELSQGDIENIIQLQRYLLSVTAKDVSLLLTYREVEDVAAESSQKPMMTFKSTGKMFRVMVSVIDLDPKPVHRISSWVRRKEEWVKIYSNLSK